MTAARTAGAMSALALSAIIVVVISLAWGSDGPALHDLKDALGAESQTLRAQVLRELRLPRVLAAFLCGGLLAVAGALMQVLFRNVLADPYVLGLAGGAGAGALGVMVFGAGTMSVFAGAWGGALLSVWLLIWFGRETFAGAHRQGLTRDVHRLLLIGVALASGWAAVITLLLALAPEASLKGMLFWMMGDLDAAEGWRLPGVVLAGMAVAAWVLARDLNVLCLGEAVAHTLGVTIGRTRLVVMLLASLATATAVTTAGTIGFIGLVVPNAVRWAIGNDQRWLLPASALAGGMLLTAADTIARTAIAPMQLPVGAIVAMIGVPAFIALLVRGRLQA